MSNPDQPKDEQSRIDHVGWFTPDLERSIAFWSNAMGFEARPVQDRRQEWIGKLMGVPGANVKLAHLYGHGGHIEFIQFIEPGDAAERYNSALQNSHICLFVEDVVAFCDLICRHGGSLKGELTEITEGPATGLRGLYAADPHGVLIELISLRPGG
ncbi:VOC family protein [Paraburkholderia youngii]|uniref:VOC family protein n=1 Tax=Paraburkholderia youngii TaxID=2782701 RepID=UPI003D1EECD8